MVKCLGRITFAPLHQSLLLVTGMKLWADEDSFLVNAQRTQIGLATGGVHRSYPSSVRRLVDKLKADYIPGVEEEDHRPSGLRAKFDE